MKVCHIIFSFTIGGAETMLVDILNEQVKSLDVCLIIINNTYSTDLINTIDKKVNVYCLEKPQGSKSIFPVLKLNYLLLKESVDLVHCHDNNTIAFLLPKFRTNSVFTVHNGGELKVKYYKYYRQIVAISKSVQNDIFEQSKIESKIIYNGVDVESVTQKTIGRSDKFKIVIVSRLEHKIKGQHIVLNALAKLNDKRVSLDIIGTGSSLDYLKTIVEQNNLQSQVKFLGEKSRKYVYKELCQYDLLIQPSLYEGFGLTIAEGMAAKLNVLVSNIDGPKEILNNGEFGFVFIPQDVDDCANMIKKIMSVDNQEIIEKAFLHVSTNYNIKQTAQQYIHLYKSL